jgi:hypothetical protein
MLIGGPDVTKLSGLALGVYCSYQDLTDEIVVISYISVAEKFSLMYPSKWVVGSNLTKFFVVFRIFIEYIF